MMFEQINLYRGEEGRLPLFLLRLTADRTTCPANKNDATIFRYSEERILCTAKKFLLFIAAANCVDADDDDGELVIEIRKVILHVLVCKCK